MQARTGTGALFGGTDGAAPCIARAINIASQVMRALPNAVTGG